MNKNTILRQVIVFPMVLGFVGLSLIGCSDDENELPFYGYYSKDGKIAIEYPRTKDPWQDPADGTWYTPVVIHRYGDAESVETNMCTVVDSGSCGNYALESKDKSVLLEDYSFGNSGDPEAVYISITFKKNGKSEMIPLERLGILDLESE